MLKYLSKKIAAGIVIGVALFATVGIAHALQVSQTGTGLVNVPNGAFIYGSSTNQSLNVLPIGSTGQVLTVVGGLPAWAAATGSSASILPLYVNGTVAGVNATSSTVSFNIQGTGSLNPFRVASSTGTAMLTIAVNGSTTIASLGTGIVRSSSGSLYTDTTTYLTSAITSINGATGPAIALATGTAGNIFNVASSSNTFTFNLPIASASNTGQLSNTDWFTFNGKLSSAITSISALTGPAIQIATTSDTNILISVSTTTANTLNFIAGFTGTLAAGRLNSNVVQAVSTSSSGTTFTASISAQNLAIVFPANLLTTTSAASLYVTNVTGSGNIASSGGLTPNITLTGIIPVANGGTGAANLTTAAVLFGNGTSAVGTSSNFTFTTATNNLFVTNATHTNFTLTNILYLTGMADGCLQVTSGIATSTGTACGSGGGGTSTSSVQNIMLPFIANGTVAGVNATSSGTSLWVQGTGALNPFAIASSTGTQLLTVTGRGNVGIGTTTPQEALVVNGRIQTQTNNSNYLALGAYNASSDNYGYIASIGQTPGTGLRLQSGNGAAGIRITIESNGNVGVGSTTPYGTLVVQGTSGSTTPTFIVATSTGAAILQVTAGGEVLLDPTALLRVPAAATKTLTTAGQFYWDTTIGQFQYYDGNASLQRSLPPYWPTRFTAASTTIANFNFKSYGSASSTFAIPTFSVANTLSRVACQTTVGTVNIQIGNGTASSTFVADTDGATTTPALAFIADQDMFMIASSSLAGAEGLRCHFDSYPTNQ